MCCVAKQPRDILPNARYDEVLKFGYTSGTTKISPSFSYRLLLSFWLFLCHVFGEFSASSD